MALHKGILSPVLLQITLDHPKTPMNNNLGRPHGAAAPDRYAISCMLQLELRNVPEYSVTFCSLPAAQVGPCAKVRSGMEPSLIHLAQDAEG